MVGNITFVPNLSNILTGGIHRRGYSGNVVDGSGGKMAQEHEIIDTTGTMAHPDSIDTSSAACSSPNGTPQLEKQRKRLQQQQQPQRPTAQSEDDPFDDFVDESFDNDSYSDDQSSCEGTGRGPKQHEELRGDEETVCFTESLSSVDEGAGAEQTHALCSSSNLRQSSGERASPPPSPSLQQQTVPGVSDSISNSGIVTRRPLCGRRGIAQLETTDPDMSTSIQSNGNPSKYMTSPPPSGSFDTGIKGKTDVTVSSHDPLVLFGIDLSHLSPSLQIVLCAGGVFCFTIVYGYLQELLAVHIAGRKFGLFLAVCQFAGYAVWSMVLTRVRAYRQRLSTANASGTGLRSSSSQEGLSPCPPVRFHTTTSGLWTIGSSAVPLRTYIALSLIRAVDLGMTNLAMQFLNYPAKTLIKSSRVVFTMLLGLVIGQKRYHCRDYLGVSLLVVGLGIFLHADSRSSVVFHPIGVMMLVISLTADGTLNNYAEKIMRDFRVGQDEFQLGLYSIAFIAMAVAAHAKGELFLGIHHFFLEPGTVKEIEADEDVEDPTWTVRRKVLVLIFFSTTGLLGSSCAGAITKRFGALSMSIVSTTRKAMTLFLSFVAFENTCTFEHFTGMIIFLGALLFKSLCATESHMNSHGAKDAEIHGSTSAMELTKLSSDEELEDEFDNSHDAGGEEIRPLIIADDEQIDLEATGVLEENFSASFEDQKTAGGSLYETDTSLISLGSLDTQLRQRVAQQDNENLPDGAAVAAQDDRQQQHLEII